MIKVKSEVTIYEIDGSEVRSINNPHVVVESHWNRDSFVVLCVGGAKVTVAAKDLHAAINNATNSARF